LLQCHDADRIKFLFLPAPRQEGEGLKYGLIQDVQSERMAPALTHCPEDRDPANPGGKV